MPDYSKGKIYKLVSNQTDDIYIGSTIQPLYVRLGGHKQDYKGYLNGTRKYVTSSELCKYDDVRILLIKEYPCENKEQLERKEGKYQQKYNCVNKNIAGTKNKCKHDIQKHFCKVCHGSEICIHNRVKYECKDCRGAGICPHNKKKRICHDCNGSVFCKHDKNKRLCRECDGSDICKHDKIKSRCITCGGSALCNHNKIKSRCISCGGSQTIQTKCPHCESYMRKDCIKKHINRYHNSV